MPSSWEIRIVPEGHVFFGSEGKGSDVWTWALPGDGEGSSGPDAGAEFLTNLGYKKDTPTYNRLLKEHRWVNGSSSSQAGEWFTDPLAYAGRVAERALQAAARAASNIYSIPACRVAAADLAADDYPPPIPA